MCAASESGTRAPVTVPGPLDLPPKLFTIQQAAEMLSITEKSLRRRIAAREVPHRKLGPRQLRLSQADIDAILAAAHVPARPEATVLTRRRKTA